MKKVLALMMGIAVTTGAFSQLSVGFQGIGNASTADVKFNGESSITKKRRAMPGAGLVLEYAIHEKLAIRSGINYLQNGITVNTVGPDPNNGDLGEIKIEAKTKLDYLQVPLNVLYTTPARHTQFFTGAGPFFNFGLSGKTKLTGTYTLPGGSTETVKDDKDAFKKESEGGAGLKRFDMGIGAIAGVKFAAGIFVNIGYQLSLLDIDANKESNYKNRGLQLTIGYLFWNRK